MKLSANKDKFCAYGCVDVVAGEYVPNHVLHSIQSHTNCKQV